LQKHENNQFCHSERSEESHIINELIDPSLRSG